MIEKPKNFLILGSINSHRSLKQKVQNITEKEWNSFVERKVFLDQRHSLTVPLYNDPDPENEVFNKTIINESLLEKLSSELLEIENVVKKTYPNYKIRRSMLVLLPAGKDVEQHTDMGYHLENVHRIHVPIKTNKDVTFLVGNKVVPMEEGSVVEINNNIPHSVKNNSTEDRVHLIVDYGKIGDPHYSA